MPLFSVKVSTYDIINCTQVQTLVNFSPVQVRIDNNGNGSIGLTALNIDEALEHARQLLENTKRSN